MNERLLVKPYLKRDGKELKNVVRFVMGARKMDGKKTNVLIVDDEPDVAASLKHFLSSKSYTVHAAYKGENALDILKKEPIDLVILDIMMFGMKGSTIARMIKEKYPDIKIIIVTAYPEEGKRLQREIHLEGLFIKPMGIQELFNKLLLN